MIRLLLGAAAGYVLGTRAGRARYEQISRGAKAVATSPMTRKAVQVGRQKLSDTLSTAPKLEPVRSDDDTTVYVPHSHFSATSNKRKNR